MTEVIIDDKLEVSCKRHNVPIKEISHQGWQYAKKYGFNPATKFTIVASSPDTTVADKQSENLVTIYLDSTLPLIEDQKLRNPIIHHQIAHELSHAAISEMGILEIVHYKVFKGKFVDEDSNGEFDHTFKNLKDNVRVDSTLGREQILRQGFLLNNVIEKREMYYRLASKRKHKTIPIDYNSFMGIIDLIHTMVVCTHYKKQGFNEGFEKQIVTDLRRLLNNYLNSLLPIETSSRVREVMNALLEYCESGYERSLEDVEMILREIWNARSDIHPN